MHCLKASGEELQHIAPAIRDAAESLKYDFDPYTASGIPDIRQVTKLSLMPNYICNFSCSYCYSAKGRSRQMMEWEKAKAMLDWFIDEKRFPGQPLPQLSLFISGGGEPLATWHQITHRLLTYARQRADEKGFPLRISIISNGSLLTRDIARELHRLHCSLCVSFEVLQHLQESQRGHYEQVTKGLDILKEENVEVLMNSTITPLSVDRMEEMVEEVARRWSFVRSYTLEPVTSTSLFASSEELRAFYDHYFTHYVRSRDIARQLGVRLRFTYDDVFRTTVVRHCPGKFCLTPMGTISVCHLVTSPKEDRYEHCTYGRVTDSGQVVIDYDKFTSLYNLNLLHYPQCTDCFAKWSCGGECLTRRETYPPSYLEEVCRFNRRFLLFLLLERVAAEVKEETGLSLEDYVRQ